MSTRTDVHRADARKAVIGFAVIGLLLLIGAVGAIVQTGGALPGRSYTYVTADFANVGVLKPGKAVKEGGVRIGQVSDVSYVDGHARVTLRLDGHRDVYRDATAKVGNVSALGKRFVDLDPGTSKAGPLGSATISLDRTQAAASVEDIFSALDPRTRTALQQALGELGGGIGGHSADLNSLLRRSPDLLADLQAISRTLTDDSTGLAQTLTSADTLVSRFQGREAQLRSLTVNLDRTLVAVGTDGGQPLARTLQAAPGTLGAARSALDTLETPLRNARLAVRDLRPGAAALGSSTPALRDFLREATTPLDKVPGVADKADPALRDVTSTVADARPLVPELARALDSLATFLRAFSPYAGDAGRFFSQHDLLSGTLQGTDDKHYFAALLTGPGLFSVAGVPDPLYRREAYPAPGTAWNHSTVTDVRGGDR